MPYLVDTGGNAKLHNMFALLRDKLPEVLEEVGAKVALEVAQRAPTPEVERDTMLYGGSTGISNMGDTDGRQRFIKPEGNYLKQFIPTSFAVEGLRLGIGNILELDRISAYSYINVKKDTRFGHQGDTLQEILHVVDKPFWWAWEVGGIFTIVPAFDNKFPYKLKPSPIDELDRMTKVIPARYMYSSVDWEEVTNTLILPKIRRLIKQL